ncbi:unnamed protein product [Pleuronectes platessa]|uniref:Uncharacterized protein n=1 Tax=Pleuronectes platessa TaxID=8262 RepID=A0A9N7W4F1_PLEPL|nr:unnamed protein product [Pleuronectes platessa]
MRSHCLPASLRPMSHLGTLSDGEPARCEAHFDWTRDMQLSYVPFQSHSKAPKYQFGPSAIGLIRVTNTEEVAGCSEPEAPPPSRGNNVVSAEESVKLEPPPCFHDTPLLLLLQSVEIPICCSPGHGRGGCSEPVDCKLLRHGTRSALQERLLRCLWNLLV